MAEERAGLPILAFANAEAFDRWLNTQPTSSAEIWVKFAKKGSGYFRTITKTEQLDAAL